MDALWSYIRPLYREPEGLEPGIRVKGLRKEFIKFGTRKRVLAVDGVSFSAYPGEITTLLGHNGAGNSSVKIETCITTFAFSAAPLNFHTFYYTVRFGT